jgi:hypothetical protein
MAKKIHSKKVGRPAMAGGSVFTAVRLPMSLSQAVDAWSVKAKVSRSVALRHLIEAGLKRRQKP